VSLERTLSLFFRESVRGFHDLLRENLTSVLMLQILPEQSLKASYPHPERKEEDFLH
jgi:hypothetical protein